MSLYAVKYLDYEIFTKSHYHYHHYHHPHLFRKRTFLPRSARVRRFPRHEASPPVPEHYPLRVHTQFLHVIPHIFSPNLPAPTRTSRPCHHHISTGRHPVISTLTLHMPKPPQSTTPHHLSHTLNPQKTVQIYTVLPILQRHPTHPSHHHPLRSLQTLQICYLHRPGFSPNVPYVTLYTSLVYLSLYVLWCTPSCQDRR